jgi:hypothetical protein
MTGVTMEGSRALIRGRASRAFEVTTGVRQGDSLSAMPSNLALHEATKEMRLGGTIVYISKQACVYANHIVLLVRDMDSLIEMFITLEEKS